MFFLVLMTLSIGALCFLISFDRSKFTASFNQLERQRLHLEKNISQLLSHKKDLNRIEWGIEYFGFTQLLKDIVAMAKHSGLPMRAALRRIRSALSCRGQFERKIHQEKNVAFLQIFLMSAMVWIMAVVMMRVAHFHLGWSQIAILLTLQAGCLLLMGWGMERPKQKYLGPFASLLSFHHSLHCYLMGGQPIHQVLERLQMEKVFRPLSENLKETYLEFLQRVREGEIESEEWSHLENDIFYHQNLALEQFQQKIGALKMFSTVLGGLGSFLYLIYQFMHTQALGISQI